MSYIEKEKLIKADIASIENRVRHAFNQGYDLGFKDGKEKAKPQEQEPTTKNYLALLEKTYDDFCKCEGGEGWLKIDGKEYGTDAGYAIEGVDIFMEVFKRRLAELPSVTPQLSSGLEKNSQKLEKDFGELDCISRADARKAIIAHQYSDSFCEEHSIDHSINTGMALIALSDLPSVTPQLCEDVVSRQAVLDLIADYDLSMGHVVRGIHALPSVTPQEPKIVQIAEIKYDKDKLKELVNKAVLTVTPQEPRWIPCSEKKPNKGGEYLLWGKICDDDEEEYCFLGDYYEFEEKFGIEKSNYDPHTLGFLDTEIEEYYSVVAWMPLPKPYEPQESEE